MTTEPVTAVQPSLGRLGPTSGPGGQAARAVLRRLEIARRYGLPRRFLSSRFAPCGAVRVGLPSNRSLSENFTALGEPLTCARGCRRSSRTYPQFRCTGLTPSCAQDLGRQQGACGRQQRGNRVARHPLQVAPPLLTDHRHGARDRGLCPWPGAAWWAGRCSSRRCRRSATRSYHSAENACRRPAMPRRRCRVVRHDNGFLALPRGPGDRALPGVFFLAWTSMNRSCRLRIRRRRGPRGPPRGPAGWDCEVRIVRHHLIALSWHPFRAQGGAATTSGASLRRSAVFAVGRRRFHSAK